MDQKNLAILAGANPVVGPVADLPKAAHQIRKAGEIRGRMVVAPSKM